MIPEAEAPFLIALNLTQRCNLACDHCYLDAKLLKEGATTLLVTHYSCLNGKDICRMWVNPALDRKPPFDAHDMAYCDTFDIGVKNEVRLNVQPHGEGDYDFDEIRIGRTWEEVIGRK